MSALWRGLFWNAYVGLEHETIVDGSADSLEAKEEEIRMVKDNVLLNRSQRSRIYAQLSVTIDHSAAPLPRFLFRFSLCPSKSASITACQAISLLPRQPTQMSIPTSASWSQPIPEQVIAGSKGPTKVGIGAERLETGLGAGEVVLGVAEGPEAADPEAVAEALAASLGGGGRVGASFFGADRVVTAGLARGPEAAEAGVVAETEAALAADGVADAPAVRLDGRGLVGTGRFGAGSLDEAKEESDGSRIDREASGF